MTTEQHRLRVARWRAANPKRAAELSKKHSQEFRDRNPERARALDLARHERDKEKRNQRVRDYFKRTGYEKNQRKINPQFKLKKNLSRYVRYKLNGAKKSADFITLLGCSILQLRAHLEKQFQPGMSWDNYGLYGWHIDHRKPCESFDLTDDEQQKQCFSYTNLQPLWAEKNLKKGAKII